MATTEQTLKQIAIGRPRVSNGCLEPKWLVLFLRSSSTELLQRGLITWCQRCTRQLLPGLGNLPLLHSVLGSLAPSFLLLLLRQLFWIGRTGCSAQTLWIIIGTTQTIHARVSDSTSHQSCSGTSLVTPNPDSPTSLIKKISSTLN